MKAKIQKKTINVHSRSSFQRDLIISFIPNMTTCCGVCHRRDLRLGKYFRWKRTKRNYLHQTFVNPKQKGTSDLKFKKFFFRFALCIRNSHCELLHNRKLMQILGRFSSGFNDPDFETLQRRQKVWSLSVDGLQKHNKWQIVIHDECVYSFVTFIECSDSISE